MNGRKRNRLGEFFCPRGTGGRARAPALTDPATPLNRGPGGFRPNFCPRPSWWRSVDTHYLRLMRGELYGERRLGRTASSGRSYAQAEKPSRMKTDESARSPVLGRIFLDRSRDVPTGAEPTRPRVVAAREAPPATSSGRRRARSAPGSGARGSRTRRAGRRRTSRTANSRNCRRSISASAANESASARPAIAIARDARGAAVAIASRSGSSSAACQIRPTTKTL